MRVLESLRQGFGGARNHDPMHVIRHEAVTQQRKTVKLGVFPDQIEVGNAVAVVGQNYLPGVTPLRNMMGNINHNDASEAGHCQKNNRKDRFAAGLPRDPLDSNLLHSQIGRTMGDVPSVPAFRPENRERPVCPRIVVVPELSSRIVWLLPNCP